jgi:hypothetical protein
MIRIILATSLLIASAVAAFGGEVKGTNGDHSNPTPPPLVCHPDPKCPAGRTCLSICEQR